VIGELTTDRLICVLNKADLLPAEGREAALAKAQKRLAATFAATRFAGCPQVVVSARPGGGEGSEVAPAEGIAPLIDCILASVQPPALEDDAAKPFLFAVDHCFTIRGQGTILTGTVIRGRCSVGQTVELPSLHSKHKIKSMQAFRRAVKEARRGDRLGVCLAQFDSKLLERGLLAEPGSVPTFSRAVAAVQKIRFFKGALPSKTRMHITIGHATVMAECTFFGGPAVGSNEALSLAAQLDRLAVAQRAASFSFDSEYEYNDELNGLSYLCALRSTEAPFFRQQARRRRGPGRAAAAPAVGAARVRLASRRAY